jgi:hypothetical protein
MEKGLKSTYALFPSKIDLDTAYYSLFNAKNRFSISRLFIKLHEFLKAKTCNNVLFSPILNHWMDSAGYLNHTIRGR